MQSCCQPRARRGITRCVILFAVFAITGTLWLFREPLQNRLIAKEVLVNDSPPPEVVTDAILKSPDPRAALLGAWNSGKIIHRESAIHSLSQVIPAPQPLPPEIEAMLLSAALDPDMNVREAAFGILRDRKDSRLAVLAAAQLHDADSQTRQLGLNQFRFVGPEVGVPAVIPLLDDVNPLIATMTLHLLENWSGEHFGAKFSDAVSAADGESGPNEIGANSNARLNMAIQRAKSWWTQHQGEYSPVHLVLPEIAGCAQPLLPAGDFQLRALDGKVIRLSDFRGKVVLINFWTTWCTACVDEIPSLTALHEKYNGKLVILGVCLDAIPDEDGDTGDSSVQTGKQRSKASTSLHDKVVRTVKARGINYPIMIDEHNTVGGKFNGGELPTTVLLDAQGNVWRRFVGARSLAEFEAMLAEIGKSSGDPAHRQPVSSSGKSSVAR